IVCGFARPDESRIGAVFRSPQARLSFQLPKARTERPMLIWNQFDRAHKDFVWMTAVFLTILNIANITSSMLFSFRLPFLSEPVLLSAGIIPFPVTFILTDLLNEFYGKQGARFVTYVGFGMSILVYLLLLVGEQLPVDPISQITRPQFLHL